MQFASPFVVVSKLPGVSSSRNITVLREETAVDRVISDYLAHIDRESPRRAAPTVSPTRWVDQQLAG